YTIDTTHLKDDAKTTDYLMELQEKADHQLGGTIAKIKELIKAKWFEDSEIMQELTNTLKEWTSADMSMLNAGLLLDDLSAGHVTYKDVHRICPHPINPVVVHLSGKELIEVVRASF